MAVLFFASSLVLVNYFVDPIQFYRKASNPVFVLNQRYQVPGLIRNYDFDTILVGTSHSENFLPELLDKALGTQSLNLSISGSSAAEQKRVVELAAETGKLDFVIWEVNYRSFSGINPNLIKGGEFPEHLYRVGLLTHTKYLFSIDTMWMSLKNLMGKGPSKLAKLNYWGDLEKHKFDGLNILKHYCGIKKKGGRASLALNYDESIHINIQEIVDANPNVKFHLFLPPFSFYNYSLGNEKEAINLFRNTIYSMANERSNVILHDFTNRFEIISNKANYKDVEHFSPTISNVILSDIAGGFYNQNVQKDAKLLTGEFMRFIDSQVKFLPDCKAASYE